MFLTLVRPCGVFREVVASYRLGSPAILDSMGIGTVINVVAVLVGGGIGTMVGAKLPEAMRRTAMQAIGIVTLLVGISNFLELAKASTTLTLTTVKIKH